MGDFKGGGVRIDEKGRTDIEGLFAAGDVAPGSSLLYALVTGVVSGRSAISRAYSVSMPEFSSTEDNWIAERRERLESVLNREPNEEGDPKEIKKKVKAIMWRCGGPLRKGEDLREGIRSLKEIEEECLPMIYASGSFRKLREALEAINMVMVGQMILRSSLFRTESRGYNQRLDYPERDDKNWLKNTIIKRAEEGVRIKADPVEFVFMAPEEMERGK